MVSFSDLFLYTSMIIGVVALCYEIFNNKKK